MSLDIKSKTPLSILNYLYWSQLGNDDNNNTKQNQTYSTLLRRVHKTDEQ